MKILLHTCCGPCGIMPVKKLLEAGHEVTVYFYNPNIHPYREYKKRRDTFRDYMSQQQVTVVIEDDYALEEFLGNVAASPRNRCSYCYKSRLTKAAAYAKNNGYDCFSSTLLVSIYQNQDLIKAIGEAVGEQQGLPFYHEDFRPFFALGQEEARGKELYLQSYCGCIYSEKERYCKKKKNKSVAITG